MMRDRLLESRIIHCDETRVQVNKEPGREPTSQSWMWYKLAARRISLARRKFVEAQKVQPKGKTGRADIALNLINKLYNIERDLKDGSDEQRYGAGPVACLDGKK